MSEQIIVLNRARCRKCSDVITSTFRHDMRWCKCGAIAVDGGRAYLARSGNEEDIEELSIVTQSIGSPP